MTVGCCVCVLGVVVVAVCGLVVWDVWCGVCCVVPLVVVCLVVLALGVCALVVRWPWEVRNKAPAQTGACTWSLGSSVGMLWRCALPGNAEGPDPSVVERPGPWWWCAVTKSSPRSGA